MASVRKREGKRSVSWICDYVTPDGKKKRKSFKMKNLAEAYKAKVQMDMNEGVYIDSQRYRKITLGNLIAKYQENFKNQLGYRISKILHVKTIKDHFGKDSLLLYIRYVDLETFRNKLLQTPSKRGKTRKDATINRCIACLRHMMNKAVSWDMLKVNPFSQGASLTLKENDQRLQFLPEAEIGALTGRMSVLFA